jgi:hypothetical protein
MIFLGIDLRRLIAIISKEFTVKYMIYSSVYGVYKVRLRRLERAYKVQRTTPADPEF